jgi:O-antigen ligase/Flp pilus assembly protein TadD
VTTRLGVGILAALGPAVAVAVDPAGWNPFGPAKWLAVSVLVPLGAALVQAHRPLRLVGGPIVAIGALAGAMALAAAFGVDPLYAWTGTPERHLGVLTWVLIAVAFVVGQSLDPTRDGPVLAGGLALAGLVTGGVATAEALGWEPSELDVGGRLSGSFGSPAYLGAAAALLLPALVGIAADAAVTARWIRPAAGVGAATLAVAVVGSGARAAWVGLAVAAGVTAWLHRRRIPRRAVVVAVIALVALVVLTPVGGRSADTFDRAEPGGRGRLDEWRVAARVVADRPLLGAGPEGYRIVFADGVDAEYERAHGRDPLPDRAHSAPLDIALAGGLPALVAWAAAVALTGRHVVRALRSGPRWLSGVAAGLLAHLAGQLLLFPTAELEPLAWLLAGVVVAATARTGECRERLLPRAATVAIGAVAVAALVVGALDLVADRRAGDAVAALARGDAATAAARAADAVSLRPDVLRLHLLEGRALVAAGEGSLAALHAVDDGLDVSPRDPIARLDRVELLVARAQATLVPEHIERARDEVADLLSDDPDNAALWLQAGVAARLAGDRAEAERAWSRAEDLAPRSAAPSTNLALLHLEAGRLDDALAAAERAVARDPDDPTARQVLDRIRDAQ